MNDVIEKVKKLKLSKKNIIIIALAAVGLILLLVSELIPSDNEDSSVTSVNGQTVISAQKYTEKAEKKLSELIASIDGAGSVRVMITLESCYENVYLKSYTSKDEAKAENTGSEFSEDYITVKNGSNTENCVVVKVYEPKIKGVAVVAEGAGNAEIRKAITDTVTAVFDISSTAVSVEKMSYNSEE